MCFIIETKLSNVLYELGVDVVVGYWFGWVWLVWLWVDIGILVGFIGA